ncbi:hypothetical protein G5B40_16725 [Pikeienuella piscinae]|uniref:DUF2147 domain-containing protein n=1 Tax=Pikeienuella piscinae TaxID=2748098 RepID=A0A7L5C1D5_9RHOB|nr:hypothetical protein [Pikeienuella piscinae]QIE56938.1 hypothetical protein G5B40_16725 [Pikeienuella piscinae]
MRAIAGVAAALAAGWAGAAAAEKITVTGEAMDTWCYFSGVMGAAEATLGTAHHTCAVWCAAGGIPVGLLAEDGTVYMILKIEDSDKTNGGDRLVTTASRQLTATGEHYRRDGIDYIVIGEVVGDAGIVNLSHEDYGVTPGFAIPEPEE